MPSTVWVTPEPYTFAMCPDSTGAREYITPFRMYPVVREFDRKPVFVIIDNDGDIITCNWKHCAHIHRVWRRIDVPPHEISLELRLIHNRARQLYREMMEET